jgi:hypothetical protein
MSCVALVGGLAACGAGETANGGETTTTTTPFVTPTPTIQPLTGKGVGPYAVDATLEDLTAAKALANLKTSDGCPDFATADATAPYSGKVTVVFFKSKLSYLTVSSPAVSTVDGAKVGMTLAEVKDLYGKRGTQLDDGQGGHALGVREGGGTGMVFRTDKSGTVNAIEAGTYDTLEFRFVEGEGC